MKSKLFVAAAIVFLAFAGTANVVMADGDSAGPGPLHNVMASLVSGDGSGTETLYAQVKFFESEGSLWCEYWPNGMGPPAIYPAHYQRTYYAIENHMNPINQYKCYFPTGDQIHIYPPQTAYMGDHGGTAALDWIHILYGTATYGSGIVRYL
ncbi:MAG: hypothetical protein IPJ89_01370 [Candidatus Iainarchaeum archaeon]|uniref:Uncharacterized protein n=1 Tax=Candidatus Iainarchaeum sp. TaxID=3101447 RepID=A0A7T9DK93_9ARCH|nr:MAG: hypothetical protein IPJ89_01370 [Candidatus Diapherotrites archaeon]